MLGSGSLFQLFLAGIVPNADGGITASTSQHRELWIVASQRPQLSVVLLVAGGALAGIDVPDLDKSICCARDQLHTKKQLRCWSALVGSCDVGKVLR